MDEVTDTMKELIADVPREACDLTQFRGAAQGFKKLYALIYSQSCAPCEDLRQRVRQTDIKTPIVEIPGDTCFEIADELGVTKYPSVVLIRQGTVKKVHTGTPAKLLERMVKGR